MAVVGLGTDLAQTSRFEKFLAEGNTSLLERLFTPGERAYALLREAIRETGAIKLRRFVSVHHVGKVLNPLLHDGQIDGGIVMGVGYALTEEMLFAEGKVTTLHFGDYKIPTMRDLPRLQKIVLEAPVGRGPYNSMSIGETAIITVAPAIANAVQDAVGLRITSLPLTAEKVLASIKKPDLINAFFGLRQ